MIYRGNLQSMFVCLFGEGTHARSDVAEAGGMAQKIVARTSFEATRDVARSDISRWSISTMYADVGHFR